MHYDLSTKVHKELLKRLDMENAKTIDTPISIATRLDMDEPGSLVNETMYTVILESLLYLTLSRFDIIFSVGLCAMFQSSPKESHLKAAIFFEVSQGNSRLGPLLTFRDNLDLVGYVDADYAGYLGDMKSISEMIYFLGSCVILWGTKK
ncbi:secreted RxLR effector protein 161-like [Nicotiana sylvestris]|uniref:secreted RxLR effector protein 161-like n=1 Tax=Nicotiana sylvestris TaxID=4096 RepID=UPI00388CC753